ncbi:MAG: fasciclin domain-containing protein [Sphingosinicella sp.]|nr:fasciclin domain-containing protein [Sphingosinicella sp.]
MSNRVILILAVSAIMTAGCQQSDEANQSVTGNVQGTNAKAGEVPKGSIGQALAGSNEHSTLVQAVKAAGLEATLAGSQPYTLFAPNNAAFGKLPGGSADELMKSESKARLTALITNHLVPGVVTNEDLSRAIERGGGKTQLATMGGSTLTISKEGNALVVTDAKGGKARVKGAETLQSNGVVHSVDGILSSG